MSSSQLARLRPVTCSSFPSSICPMLFVFPPYQRVDSLYLSMVSTATHIHHQPNCARQDKYRGRPTHVTPSCLTVFGQRWISDESEVQIHGRWLPLVTTSAAAPTSASYFAASATGTGGRSSGSDQSSNTRAAVGGAIGGVAALLLVAAAGWLLLRRRRRRQGRDFIDNPKDDDVDRYSISPFDPIQPAGTEQPPTMLQSYSHSGASTRGSYAAVPVDHPEATTSAHNSTQTPPPAWRRRRQTFSRLARRPIGLDR
jgi:hypothetical protein